MNSFYRSTTRRDNIAVFMGKSGCDDECSSPSSDYSDMLRDSTWGPEGEEEVAISSEKPAISSRSGEEVSSKKSFDHDEGSESGKGSPEGKYKCSICGVLHLKPSLLKQHMCTHSEDVRLVYIAILADLALTSTPRFSVSYLLFHISIITSLRVLKRRSSFV
jgi:hypothetical protein